MNTQITSVDENPTTAFTLPDLSNLVQTPSDELSRGLYSFLALAEGCMWMPAFGFENGARTDGWFSALLEGDEDAWHEIEEDYEDAQFRFLDRSLDFAVITVHYDGKVSIDSTTDSVKKPPKGEAVQQWMRWFGVA